MQDDAQTAYDRREADLTPEVMRELERRVVLSVLDAKWREHLYEMDYLREGISLRAMAQRDPLIEYQREGFDLFNAMMDAIKEESVGNLFTLQVEVQQSPIVGEAGPDGEWTNGDGHVLTAGGTVQDAAPARSAPASRGATAPAAASARRGGPAPAPRPDAAVAGAAAGGDGADLAVPAAFMPRGLAQPKRPAKLSYSAPSEDGSGQAVQTAGTSSTSDFSRVGRNEPCPCGSGKKFKLCHGDPRNRQ